MPKSLKTWRCLVMGTGLLLSALAVTMPPAHGQTPASAPAARTPSDVIILDDLEDLYMPVPFDHKGHADMMAMTTGCIACHHHTPEGTAPAACRTCHERSGAANGTSMPGLKGAYHRQCMGCHREWSHRTACNVCHRAKDDPGTPADVSALPSPGEIARRMHPPIRIEPTYVYRTSHEAGPVVTFQHGGHARAYGLGCADCHTGDSCARCHDYSAERTASPLSRHETCLSCHREENCGFCHGAAERPPFHHASSVGWPLEPYHAKVSCIDCHGPARSFAAPSTSCSACHANLQTGRFDHRFTDSNVDCASCHPDKTPPGDAAHERHEALDEGCTACHDPNASDVAARLLAPVPELCFSCHEDMRGRVDDAVVAHGPATGDGACTSCHDPHHARLPRLLKRPQMNLCLGCHDEAIETGRGRPLTNMAALLDRAPNRHGPIRDGNCTACHQPHAGGHFRLLRADYPRDLYAAYDAGRYQLCFGCHDESLVESASAIGRTGFRHGDRNLHALHVNREKGRTCRACHDVHASVHPFHLREATPLGNTGAWLRLNYERLTDGGRCGPGCHRPATYLRTPMVAG